MACTDNSSSGGIRVIECPDVADLHSKQSCSSVIELQTANGTPFRMWKVLEDNPENEYDLLPGKYEGD